MNKYNFLSKEERLVYETAIGFVGALARSGECASRDWRADWAKVVELGWPGVLVPADFGGFEGSCVDILLLSQALGHGVLTTPFLICAALVAPLMLGATEHHRSRWLPEMLSGGARVVLAHEERSLDPLGNEVTTQVAPSGAGLALNGAKRMVLYGADADVLIVSARRADRTGDHGPELYRILRSAAGVTVIPYRLIDGTEAADFIFRDVRLDDGALMGPPDKIGLVQVRRAQLLAVLCAVGEAIGCLETGMAATIKHVLTRRQFDKPLAELQVVRHRIADMYIAIEELRSLAFAAARTEDDDERERTIRAAKIHLGQAGVGVAEQSVQLHGAMGVTEECVVGRVLKRITVLDRLFGGADYHIGQLGACLCERAD